MLNFTKQTSYHYNPFCKTLTTFTKLIYCVGNFAQMSQINSNKMNMLTQSFLTTLFNKKTQKIKMIYLTHAFKTDLNDKDVLVSSFLCSSLDNWGIKTVCKNVDAWRNSRSITYTYILMLFCNLIFNSIITVFFSGKTSVPIWIQW